MRYNLTKKTHLYGSVGKAFRIPTFTELYYSDPANNGNPELKEEKAWIYELGYGYETNQLRANLAIFQRDTDQLIDWVWSDFDSLWQVQNLFRVRTYGFEGGLQYRPASGSLFSIINQFSFHYTYLESEKDLRGQLSKYALSYMRQHLVAGIAHNVFVSALQMSWKFRLEDRLLYNRHFLTDLRLQWKTKQAVFNLDMNNLFDAHYEDYFNIPLPGRTIRLGLQFEVI